MILSKQSISINSSIREEYPMSRYTKTMREALSEVKAVEAHECEKAHPNMSHIEWLSLIHI